MDEQQPYSTPPQPDYTQAPPPAPGYYAPPQGYAPPPVASGEGLSDNAAGALAYVTFIPALIFLLMAPYNQKPLIKFHAIQEIGLTVVMFVLSFFLIIPILGWLVYLLGFLVCLVMWILCIIKASQGGAFKIPVLGNFAATQSGYRG
jgi:uncharacterized membrane protein